MTWSVNFGRREYDMEFEAAIEQLCSKLEAKPLPHPNCRCDLRKIERADAA